MKRTEAEFYWLDNNLMRRSAYPFGCYTNPIKAYLKVLSSPLE
jgi:hypothetical protein